MPTSGKLFLYLEKHEPGKIIEKLEKFDEDTGAVMGFNTSKRIRSRQSLDELDTIIGDFSYDIVYTTEYRGNVIPTPKTIKATYVIFTKEDEPYLMVLAPKHEANHIANELSVILHGGIGSFVEPVLNLRELKQLYESSEATKIALFDNIDIPNMDKGTLYGSNVIQTDLYGRFVNHGDPWYVVFKEKTLGITIGLVRDGTIVCFSSVSNSEYLTYVNDHVIPLVLRRQRDEDS